MTRLEDLIRGPVSTYRSAPDGLGDLLVVEIEDDGSALLTVETVDGHERGSVALSAAERLRVLAALSPQPVPEALP